MANTFALAGSPLGLINLKSRPERTGMSTFNGGRSRNMDVFKYNRGVPQPTGIDVGGKEAYAPLSALSGGSLPTFWPNANIGNIGSEHNYAGTDKGSGGKKIYPSVPGTGINDNLHNDASYDTSILNIIERLSKTKVGALRPQDFAYCKKLGVFPNNRLIIARRFPAPVKDSIFGKAGAAPKSVLITWRDDSDDFLEFTFGEEWIDADADFTNVLNKLGKDFGIDNAGTGLSKAFNAIPLPGFTEQLQRQILEKIGVLKPGSSSQPLPSGNPNLIKQAKRRKTLMQGEAGAGLKCSISVKMTCEYEQKFISGIDPTAAWQDILNNILIFGTSNSSDYGLDPTFEKNLEKWATNPGQLIITVISAVKSAAQSIISKISNYAADALKKLDNAIKPSKEKSSKEQKADNKSVIDKAEKQITSFFNRIIESAFATISKYKIEIMGIAHALSGSPSTPWHVTIGNPLRPFFCAGDMLPSGEITVKFGPQLAFNDLPSSITVDFTLVNARPLGMQEILAKFNSGSVRTVNIRKDFVEDQLPETEKEAEDALNNWQTSYFDGVFDAQQNALGAPPAPPAGENPGSSPSAVDNSAYLPLGSQTGSQVVTQLQITTGPDGSLIVTTVSQTLKDNGDVVALIEPSPGPLGENLGGGISVNQQVVGLDSSTSILNTSAFSSGQPF